MNRDDIDNFNLKDHQGVIDVFNQITKNKSLSRNDGIYMIGTSDLTELEKIVLAVNVGEYKARRLTQENTERITKTTMYGRNEGVK